LVYLIVIVSTGHTGFPLISVLMIACVYGLQVRWNQSSHTLANFIFVEALIFIIRREFMLVGWMVVYLLSYVHWLRNNIRMSALTLDFSYPIYSFLLPVYSFWCMDEFGWGNTRLVIGEGNSKKVLMNEDERFDESMIPLKKFSGMEFCVQRTQQSYAALQSTRPRPGKLARITLRRLVALN
jgi:chitin synthase